jgi:hypothetical protein
VNVSALRRWGVAVLVGVAAVAAPTAHAHTGAGEPPTTSTPSTSLWTATGREIDRLGPKHVPLQHRIVQPATVVRVVKPAGFVWSDAAIGAGAAGLAVALVAALAVLLTGRGRRPELPDRSDLAGI